MKKPKYNLQTLGHDTGDLKALLNILSPPRTTVAVKQNKGGQELRMRRERCPPWHRTPGGLAGCRRTGLHRAVPAGTWSTGGWRHRRATSRVHRTGTASRMSIGTRVSGAAVAAVSAVLTSASSIQTSSLLL